jgi:sterol desaturase/sphingolipid hydroxylase (fatty acid hydroxylase superfamily)
MSVKPSRSGVLTEDFQPTLHVNRRLGALLSVIFGVCYALPVWIAWFDGTWKGLIAMYTAILTPLVLDVCTSDATAMNFSTLRGAGFKDWHLCLSMLINFVILQGGSYAVVVRIRRDSRFDELNARISAELIVKVVCALITADVAYYHFHRFLHRQWPNIHLMHHLCLRTSATTTMIAHPVDLLFEMFPVGGVIAAAFTQLSDDPFAFLVTMTIANVWYPLGHDEWLQLAHARHHRYTNSSYWAYWSFDFKFDKFDLVKRQVFDAVHNKEM